MKTLSIFLLAAALSASRAQDTITQTFTLRPGWNAIWLEVRPTNTDVSAVFVDVPIESVWTFQERLSAVDFIQDPSEPVWNKDRWLVHVPTNRVESFQNNLFAVQANRAYLVKLEAGGGDVTLTVTGRPSLRVPEWVPNAYNLRGFPLDPAAPPTFQSFFQYSSAHFDAGAQRLQKIYRLNASGQWTVVALTDLMRSGEACWVYTQGASDYQGPLAVRVDIDDGLVYGYVADRLSLRLQNLAASPATVTLADLGAPAPNPLSYYRLDPTNGVEWIPLPSPHTVLLEPASQPSTLNSQLTLRLAVRRPDMTDESYATVLEVGDGAGLRYQVPVNIRKVMASTLQPQPAPSGLRMASAAESDSSEEETYAGLWVGTATINAVSEAHGGVLVTNLYAYVDGAPTPLHIAGVFPYTNRWTTVNDKGQQIAHLEVRATNAVGAALPVLPRVEREGGGALPTPTGNEFNLRLLIHVDADGQARLLKEVIQMWKEGTYTNDANGYKVLDQPGYYVLVTDETLLPQFRGAAVRDGQEVGRRISTADFDFPSSPTNNFLPLTGQFSLDSGQLTGAIVLDQDAPTNPFKHKYHPDHGQGYSITRELEMEFFPTSTTGLAETRYGYDVIGGLYRETITGLHKSDIVAQGTFSLNRVAITPYLNQ